MALTKAQKATRDQAALALHLEGATIPEVAAKLKFSRDDLAREAIGRGLRARYEGGDIDRHLEERARIDALYELALAEVANGKTGALGQLVKLQEMRVRTLPSVLSEQGRLRKAVDETVAAINPTKHDSALVASLVTMADMMDAALVNGTTDDHRRVINATATFRNLLADLGATPAARGAVDSLLSTISEEAGPSEPEEPKTGPERFLRGRHLQAVGE